MWQKHYQRYQCDECHNLIMKSAPVYYYDGKEFCSPECRRAYMDKQEEDRRWQEGLEFSTNTHEYWD